MYEVILYNFGSLLIEARNKKQARAIAKILAPGFAVHSVTKVA